MFQVMVNALTMTFLLSWTYLVSGWIESSSCGWIAFVSVLGDCGNSVCATNWFTELQSFAGLQTSESLVGIFTNKKENTFHTPRTTHQNNKDLILRSVLSLQLR